MKELKLTFLMLFASLSLIAQELSIEGTVTSASDGLELPGVTVLQKGTTNGTITNIDGYYQLKVSEGAILQFSFVGMEAQEVLVEGQGRLDVQMTVETTGLDEVVVIGYGSVKKKDLTGSVSMVDSKTIDKMKPVKIEQALQGTMAGVNVTTQSGAPGAGLDIRIRGISTNGDASPVAIIDGYEGDLNTLNPNDIESITVLKDAQAAIYGTVGANGVILITTKKGRRNTPTVVNINSSYGIQETTRVLPVLDAYEYAVLLNESFAASGKAIPFANPSDYSTGTQWQDALFSRAPIMKNDISMSGGSDKMVFTLSASDLRQEGIIGGDKSGFIRNSARMSMGADLSEWLKFNTSLTYTHINRKSFNESGLGSVLFNAINMPPTVPIYDENNDYYLAPANLGIEIINPLAQLANTNNDYDINKLNGNFGLDAEITSNLTATARIGFNTANSYSKSFSKIVDYEGGKVFNVFRSSVGQGRDNYNDYTFDAFLNYDKTFKDVHHITATFGTTAFKTWGNSLSGTGYDIPYNSWDFADISLAPGVAETKSVGSYTYDQRRLSYFARAQYDYMGKYLLSAMLRRDASTKFGPDNAVAYFPSATLGWNISDEDFMSDMDKIDHAKLRLSYGILGSDKIGTYQYISQLSGEATYVQNGALVYGKATGVIPNPSIKWEQSKQFDVGFDLKLLKNRIDISSDYFIKTTADLLIGNIPVSGILGIAAPGAAGPTANAGTVRNSGYEFAIGYRGSLSEDVGYRINYNLTALKNEVLEVNNGIGFIEGGSFGVGQPSPARMEVGFPIGYFYGYKTDGVFQNQAEVDAHPSQISLGAEAVPGDIRFVDDNEDGVIDTDDRTLIGNPIPDFIMGLNITFNYKNFDFTAYTYASLGNDMVRNYERVQEYVNKTRPSLARWTGEGTSTVVPRLTSEATANTIFSDYYVEDASFIRIQNVQLGYTFDQSLTERIKIDELKLFVSVSNLLTLTRYYGFDPAASSGAPIGSGFDAGFYPAPRTYTFGLNLNF